MLDLGEHYEGYLSFEINWEKGGFDSLVKFNIIMVKS